MNSHGVVNKSLEIFATQLLPSLLKYPETNITTVAAAPYSCENTPCKKKKRKKKKVKNNKKKKQPQNRKALPWLCRSGNQNVSSSPLGKGRALPRHNPAQSHQQFSTPADSQGARPKSCPDLQAVHGSCGFFSWSPG